MYQWKEMMKEDLLVLDNFKCVANVITFILWLDFMLNNQYFFFCPVTVIPKLCCQALRQMASSSFCFSPFHFFNASLLGHFIHLTIIQPSI